MPVDTATHSFTNTAEAPIRVFHSFVEAQSTAFCEHHHTACEITAVLSGSGVYATKETEFDFCTGDIFFFGTNEYHFIKKINENAAFLNIHFEPRCIWSDNFGISNTELIRIFFNREKSIVNKLGNAATVRTILSLMHGIDDEATQKRPEYATMIKIHLTNILVELLRSLGSNSPREAVRQSPVTLHAVETAINYIDQNLESDLTLELISDCAHMSKTYFCSRFKKLNGISAWEYITIKRIERALVLIETTSLTMAEIAARCGYNNTSNFYHAFRKVTGKAPRDYKA